MSRNFKRFFLILFDLMIAFGAHILSFFFLSPLVEIDNRTFLYHFLFIIGTYILFGSYTKLFDKINRFTGVQETLIHIFAITSSYFIGTLLYIFFFKGVSFRYVAFAFMLSVSVIPSSRLLWRLWIEFQRKFEYKAPDEPNKPIRTLLIGAGEGGALFIRALRNRPDIQIIGFLDDDRNKQRTTLYGYPILGKIDDLKTIVDKYKIEQITIAIPSLSKTEMNSIVIEARKTNIKTNQMPYIEDIVSGDYHIGEFKDIEIADLLGRSEVELDTQVIRKQISDKTILVSGAGGSIGSEICRQVASFNPKRIILVGHGEYSIYKIDQELRKWPNRTFEILPVIVDIQDRNRIFEVMYEYQPNLVYHAAAHKHVPLMEANPQEAVKNNVFGTKNLAEAAKKVNVDSFVMISTDKAVNPPNVMGSTKRIAEMIITGLNEPDKTNFTCVRFGNVLGSSGSVVPVFKEQIIDGGPVTVTDFRMTRYFMTIPEASRLVLQAGALAEGGEIFVLDMGTPVKIVDLAKQMVWLSGHTENEIEIVETGIRPGEKLYEELLASDENTGEQVFEKIFVGKVCHLPLYQVYKFIDSLEGLSKEELKNTLIKFANNSFQSNEELIKNI